MPEIFSTIGRPGMRCALLERKEITRRISSYLQASVSANFTDTKEQHVSHPASAERGQRKHIDRLGADSHSKSSGTSTTTPNTDSNCPVKLPLQRLCQGFGLSDTQKSRRGCYLTAHDN